MPTLTNKYARIATERRAATSSGDAADWIDLVSIEMPNPSGKGRPATFAFTISPANGQYSESIMLVATSSRGKKGVFRVDAAFVAAMSEIDWAAICEACEKRDRLSEYRAPAAPVAAPAPTAPNGLFSAPLFPPTAPVFEAPASKWDGRLSVKKRIVWLSLLAPDYAERFEALTTKDQTDEDLRTLINAGVAVMTEGGPRPA